MLVSLIVPVYGSLPDVLKLCGSIIKNPQEKLLEVILMDDATPDFDLREIILPPFKTFRNEVNKGFVANINEGARHASSESELLFFCNSDIEFKNAWLDPAVELFENNPKVGVVGIKLIFPKTPDTPELIQNAGGWYDGRLAPFHRYFMWSPQDRRVNKIEKVSWTTGAAFLTRKDLFNQVGGFDEAYGRGYYEEVDYCEKIKELGFEVWYHPRCEAYHRVGTSMALKDKTEEQTRLASKSFRQNAIRFHSKWDSKIKADVQFITGNL